jgi:hypothetical protein
VDSGNLAGHLLVVKQWCKEQLRSGVVPQYAREGIIDTLIQLTREISQVKTVSITAGGVTVQQLQDGVNAAIDLVKKSRSATLTEWEDFLLSLRSHLSDAEDVLNALCLEPRVADKFAECRVWMSLALKQVTELQRDVDLLQPQAAYLALYLQRKAAIAETSDQMFYAMDFTFLFDAQRKVITSCSCTHADTLTSSRACAAVLTLLAACLCLWAVSYSPSATA